MILDFFKETVGRNIDVKDAVGNGSQGSEEHGREGTYYLREDLNHHKHNADRNKNAKEAAGEGEEIHVMEN